MISLADAFPSDFSTVSSILKLAFGYISILMGGLPEIMANLVVIVMNCLVCLDSIHLKTNPHTPPLKKAPQLFGSF